jgi:hypothetical protein
VECADNAALEDRPETLNRVGMDCSYDVLAFGVINDAVRIFLAELSVPAPLIGAEQTDLVRDGFADEGGESGGLYVRDHTGDHITQRAQESGFEFERFIFTFPSFLLRLRRATFPRYFVCDR